MMNGVQKDFQNLMEQVYGPLNKDKMTEIEEVKAQIKVLQSKLSFLEELEKTKSPVEEAYKDWWGEYPGNENWTSDATRWQGFQAGYNAAYEEKVSEEPEELMEKLGFVKNSDGNWTAQPLVETTQEDYNTAVLDRAQSYFHDMRGEFERHILLVDA